MRAAAVITARREGASAWGWPRCPRGFSRGQTLPLSVSGGADPIHDPITELCLFSILKVLKTPLLSSLQVPGAAGLRPTPPCPRWGAGKGPQSPRVGVRSRHPSRRRGECLLGSLQFGLVGFYGGNLPEQGACASQSWNNLGFPPIRRQSRGDVGFGATRALEVQRQKSMSCAAAVTGRSQARRFQPTEFSPLSFPGCIAEG